MSHNNASARPSTNIAKQGTIYAGSNPELYAAANLHETVDLVTGVGAQEYARIKEIVTFGTAFMNCADYAIIGFWDLDKPNDTFKCSRFFIAPSPMKRTIQDSDETELDQILYTSDVTNDVFFFFKGYLEYQGDDLDEVRNTQNDFELQIAFLNLTPSAKELADIGESRHIYQHCKQRYHVPDDTILNEYIKKLDTLKYEEQDQMPNPTVINTITDDKDM